MLRAILSEVVDLIIPPRASERVVRTLTLAQLRELMQDDGLPYHDPRVTALVWELKYYAGPRAAALGGALIAEHMLAAAAEELGQPILVPVPMHAARRAVRGHNQTEVLCEAALRHLEGAVEYRPQSLVRLVNTPAQQGLSRRERLRNLDNSMEARGVEGRACIVVDDVTTTGATLAEAKRALRAAGARAVHTIALARS